MTMLTANLLIHAVAAFAVGSTLASMGCLFLRTRKRSGLPDFTPPVTIFKPLKGVDEGLEENLRSFFRLDYPDYQLLFGVADADDPAIAVVERLLAEFPDHDARLVVGCPAFGLNPKVENLAAMDRYRKHDVILISDSNVRVRPSYLRETACYLAEPGVGLVTQHLRRASGEAADRRGAGEPPAQRVHRRRRGAGGVAGDDLRGRQVDADAASGPRGDRRVRRGPQPPGRGPGDRRAGPQGGVLDPAEPSRHREREHPPRVPLVPEPALALVQDPPPTGPAVLPGRAGREPHGRSGWSGPCRARPAGSPGAACSCWSAWASSATPSRPDRLRGSFPKFRHLLLSPDQGPVPAAGLVRRPRQPPRPVARARFLVGRMHAAAAGAGAAGRAAAGPAGPEAEGPARGVLNLAPHEDRRSGGGAQRPSTPWQESRERP